MSYSSYLYVLVIGAIFAIIAYNMVKLIVLGIVYSTRGKTCIGTIYSIDQRGKQFFAVIEYTTLEEEKVQSKPALLSSQLPLGSPILVTYLAHKPKHCMQGTPNRLFVLCLFYLPFFGITSYAAFHFFGQRGVGQVIVLISIVSFAISFAYLVLKSKKNPRKDSSKAVLIFATINDAHVMAERQKFTLQYTTLPFTNTCDIILPHELAVKVGDLLQVYLSPLAVTEPFILQDFTVVSAHMLSLQAEVTNSSLQEKTGIASIQYTVPEWTYHVSYETIRGEIYPLDQPLLISYSPFEPTHVWVPVSAEKKKENRKKALFMIGGMVLLLGIYFSLMYVVGDSLGEVEFDETLGFILCAFLYFIFSVLLFLPYIAWRNRFKRRGIETTGKISAFSEQNGLLTIHVSYRDETAAAHFFQKNYAGKKKNQIEPYLKLGEIPLLYDSNNPKRSFLKGYSIRGRKIALGFSIFTLLCGLFLLFGALFDIFS